MNDLTSSDYNITTASFEIILLVAGAFLLGAMCCYLLRMLGLCCRKEKVDIPTGNARNALQSSQAAVSATTHLATDGGSLLDGDRTVYEADINSLIRSGNDTGNYRVERPAEQTTSSTSFERRARESLANLREQNSRSISPVDYTLDIPVPDDDHVDDLKKLEGIDSRIEKLLNDVGIKSYAKLATMDRDYLKNILEKGGRKFKTNEPKSWTYQAELAAKDNWSRLKEYQDFLLDDRS